jgi:hypothetical protein
MVVGIGFPDTLSMAQTIGIVGTMILTLYFSKRQIQSDDNEWAGWLQWMRNCFRKGTIKETWK